MAYARFTDGSWTEIVDDVTIGTGDDAVLYPAGWFDGADADQRAGLGVAAIVEDGDVAPSLQLLGQVLVDVDGVPHRRWAIPPVADVRAARRAELADYRWRRQQTVKWRGRIAAADDTTLGRLLAGVMRAQLGGGEGFPLRWKFGDQDFDMLTLADITAYGMAIGANMQACYDREAELVAAIAAATSPQAIAAIDITGGWPG